MDWLSSMDLGVRELGIEPCLLPADCNNRIIRSYLGWLRELRGSSLLDLQHTIENTYRNPSLTDK